MTPEIDYDAARWVLLAAFLVFPALLLFFEVVRRIAGFFRKDSGWPRRDPYTVEWKDEWDGADD
jgi:hypothetical protein